MSLSTYTIKRVLLARQETLMEGAYLILLHARQSPPHIYLSIAGKLFSIGVNGPSVDARLSSMLRYIHARKIETLFLEMILPPIVSVPELIDRIRTIVLNYNRVEAGVATCLTPVRDFCHEIYGTGTRKINLIFDLLPKLREKGGLGSVSQLYLDDALRQGDFEMNRYKVSDIYESIHKARAAIPY